MGPLWLALTWLVFLTRMASLMCLGIGFLSAGAMAMHISFQHAYSHHGERISSSKRGDIPMHNTLQAYSCILFAEVLFTNAIPIDKPNFKGGAIGSTSWCENLWSIFAVYHICIPKSNSRLAALLMDL